MPARKTINKTLAGADALLRQGRLDEALALYKAAIHDDPSNIAAILGLGCIAHERGRLRNAVALFNRALKTEPENALALGRLGLIALQKQQTARAVDFLKRAIKSSPDDASLYNNLAIAQMENGDFWEAEAISREGIDRDNEFEPLYRTRAQALQLQGRTEEGLAVLGRAPRETPENLCNRGVALLNLGRGEEAAAIFKTAMARYPDYIDAHFLYGGVHKYAPGDPHIAVMENLLARFDPAATEAGWLHFALGKAYDEAGDYDRAFAHIEAGNARMRALFPGYNAETVQHGFAAIRGMFGGNFMDRALASHQCDFTPVFIVGMPRSGTTLVDQILCAHPLVSGAGEAPYLQQVAQRHGLFKYQDIGDVPDRALQAMADEYASLLRRHAPEAKFITDKMPLNFRFAGLIRLLFPQAKIINCRRDARDCGFSIYRHLFAGAMPFAYDQELIGLYSRAYEDLMKFWHGKLPGFIHDVAYEDMVRAQEKTTRTLLDFCGLPWDNSCLSFHKSGRAVMTASAMQVRQPIYGNSIGIWKRYEKHLGVLLETLRKQRA